MNSSLFHASSFWTLYVTYIYYSTNRSTERNTFIVKLIRVELKVRLLWNFLGIICEYRGTVARDWVASSHSGLSTCTYIPRILGTWLVVVLLLVHDEGRLVGWWLVGIS